MSGKEPRARFILNNPSHEVRIRKTFTLKAVSATVGADIDVNNKRAEPRWQIDAALGRSAEARITSAGFTLAKNWDAEMGPLSANVELRGHMSWRGVPTVTVDMVPLRGVSKAVTGGVAFAVGKTLDVNPRVKLGNLPVKVEVGASIYKEGGEDAQSEVLVLRVKSVNALVLL